MIWVTSVGVSALLLSTATLALARSTDGEDYHAYYRDTLNTYGNLDLDDYFIPERWRTLLVVYKGEPINITLDTTSELDRQTHATACADACTENVDCFAFLVGFHELSGKECQLLSKDYTYGLESGDYFWDGPKDGVIFKQLYFKAESPCTDDQRVTYRVQYEEEFYYRDLGCHDLIPSGGMCDGELVNFVNAHGAQTCVDGTKCVYMFDILDNIYINGWHDMIETCESPETIKIAKEEVETLKQREANYESDMASGAYDELLHGTYTVPDYKTMRSKMGEIPFRAEGSDRDSDLKPVLSLNGADSYATADAYAMKCAEACDVYTGCFGFAIVWQSVNPGANVCYIVVGEVYFSEYDMNRGGPTPFVGQVFVPKDYTECPGSSELSITYRIDDYAEYFRIRGCIDKTPSEA